MTRAERLAAIYDEVTTAAGTATEHRRRVAAERLLLEVCTEVQRRWPCVALEQMTEAQQEALIEAILNSLGVTVGPVKMAVAKRRLKDLYLWVDRVYPLCVVTDEY